MFKSQLQEYSQKAGLLPPVYEFTREGPSHRPWYKAAVTVKGVKYESPSAYANLKKAEHAAAKAALEVLSKSSIGDGLYPEETGLCKSLLQEYAQKLSLPLPVYRTVRSGEVHVPSFTSTVEIAGRVYKGSAAKCKKEAEVKAAMMALQSIYSENRSQSNVGGSFSSFSTQLEQFVGKKRGSTEALLSEPSAVNAKVENAKQAKVDGVSLPLSGASRAEVDCVPLGDLKPTYLETVPSSIEIPGLDRGSEPKQLSEIQSTACVE